MENTIIVTSSSQLSKDLEGKLTDKLTVKFGNHPLKFEIDTSLILGMVIKFKDDEFFYNLDHEIEHILQELAL